MEGIRIEEWDEYFRGLLGGVEWKYGVREERTERMRRNN